MTTTVLIPESTMTLIPVLTVSPTTDTVAETVASSEVSLTQSTIILIPAGLILLISL
jgi:hypothetical protein